MKKLFSLLTFTFIFSMACSTQQHSLTLVSGETGTPIEGAIVFQDGNLHVLRSDLNGIIELPAAYLKAPLHIHAKDHLNLTIESPATTTKAVMVFDSLNYNKAEANLKFTKADTLRGTYSPFRANNDLLTYDLNIRIDLDKKYITGYNTIAFKMLDAGDTIQIDLFENMVIDSIVFEGKKLDYRREFNAVFIGFPQVLSVGKNASIDFYYSGYPQEAGRFGGFVFTKDSLGNHWVYSSCQNIGASLWWPNKDQQPDEVESMKINVEIPKDYIDVSNGQFYGVEKASEGFVRYKWKVNYPINNYSVAVNIAKYAQFAEPYRDGELQYFVLPAHLEAAKRQFAQAKPMMEIYEKYFGPYPFPKDGYKLIEVPFSGMEHQSAVAYGNGFVNGYLRMDWTGVGISTKFDFIIIHESGHEWFGNNISCNDVSDAWIHEGWCTYAECVYVEGIFGYEDAMKYVNGYKPKVRNQRPIIGPTGVNYWPGGDQYFKGALFLNTLRNVVDDDEQWWAMVRDINNHFRLQNIWTTDMINYFNGYFKRDFRPIFEQYLYRAEIPKLEVKFESEKVSYRWNNYIKDFNMPIKVRVDGELQTVHPTSDWKSDEIVGVSAENWKIADDLLYVEVSIVD